jgi:subfamily B ATP-binding cassette protein MsbA
MNTPEQINPQLSDLKRMLFLVLKFIRPYWKRLILFFALVMLATVFAAVLPLTLAPILDAVVGKTAPAAEAGVSPAISNLSLKNIGAAVIHWLGLGEGVGRFKLVLIFSFIYLGMGLLKNLCNFGSYMVALWIRVQSGRDMQYELFKHLLTLPLGFFYRQKTGELMSRLENDTLATTSGFQNIMANLIMAPMLIVFYGLLLLRTSPRLCLVAVIGAGFHYGFSRWLQGPLRRNLVKQFSHLAELSAQLQESLVCIRIIKSFRAEQYELKKLRSAAGKVLRASMKFGFFKDIEKPSREVLNRFVEVGILLFAAYELLSGAFDAAAFFMFLYVGRSIITPISDLGTTYTGLQHILAASDRVFSLFSLQPQVVDGTESIQGFQTALKIDRVSFAYDSRNVLEDITLTVAKGERVALVGPSGAGKSTLSDLLLRFYDPHQGGISIDGRDVRALQQSSYRRLFGVVPQEALLFNATVRDNIAYGREGITEQDILEAASIANAHEFIMELPRQYDTFVGDRGTRLSGGQRQRIAIARAIVARPEILILDEATSALDSESEKLVQAAIERIIENSTAVIIAHRLSTILHSDVIVVMDEGRIVDQGRHEELLRRCELYQRLCYLQFNTTALRPAAAGIEPEENSPGRKR